LGGPKTNAAVNPRDITVRTIPGNARVNIAKWCPARPQRNQRALAVVKVDDPVPAKIIHLNEALADGLPGVPLDLYSSQANDSTKQNR
jgi:hypothetical protein